MKSGGTERIVNTLETVITDVQTGVEHELQPLRKSVIKRFPTLFLLAVTFGVALVFYSIEVLLSQSLFVQEYPHLALGIGLAILIVTGTLYRKLE